MGAHSIDSICLVRPPAVESFRFVTTTVTLPLGLAYIAAALEQAGYSIHVLDAVADAPTTRTRYYEGVLLGSPLEEIARRVPADVTMVGISVVFTHEWPAVVRLIDLIKQRFSDVPVVVGGEHVTSMPEFCLATSKADFVVLGEGEETIVELAQALRTGASFDEIAGLGFRVGGHITINPRRARRMDIDAIAYPAWHRFDIKAYSEANLVGGMGTNQLNLPLLATRGCPYQCTFCSSPNMWLPRWIPRDPVKVVDEIEHHVRRYGARSFPFQDLTAIVQKDWIVTFCRELLARRLDVTWQFPSGTRSEAIDFEVADLMRRSGMVSIAYAPESGSEQTRKLIKKRMQTDALLESITASVEAKLNVTCFLIVGFPHDTHEQLEETRRFVTKIRRMGVTDLGIGYFFALPGTELFDSLYDAGKTKIDKDYFAHILQGGDLMLPAVSYAEHLSRLDMARWQLQLYLAFYGTAIANQPGTSLGHTLLHAAKGLFKSDHESKLQTVFRAAMAGGWHELRLAPTRGWISRQDEDAMFRGWDAIYRRIRRELRDKGVIERAPADTTQLHTGNVMKRLKPNHGTRRTLEVVR